MLQPDAPWPKLTIRVLPLEPRKTSRIRWLLYSLYREGQIGNGPLVTDTFVKGNEVVPYRHTQLKWDESIRLMADDDGYTIMHHAAAMGQDALIRMLVESGCQASVAQYAQLRIKAKYDNHHYRLAMGVTPLHLAAFYGHERVVATLLEKGAAVDAGALVRACELPNPTGRVTPLYLALQEGHLEVARMLYEGGASLGESIRRPSHGYVETAVRTCLPGLGMRFCWARYRHLQIQAVKEHFEPITVADADGLRKIFSTEKFNTWLHNKAFGGQNADEAKNTICRYVFSGAIARLIGSYVVPEANRHTRVEAMRRLKQLLCVLVDFGMLRKSIIESIYSRAGPKISPSYTRLGQESYHYGKLFLAAPDYLMLVCTLAGFGIFPSRNNLQECLNRCIDAFEEASELGVCTDLIPLATLFIKMGHCEIAVQESHAEKVKEKFERLSKDSDLRKVTLEMRDLLEQDTRLSRSS